MGPTLGELDSFFHEVKVILTNRGLNGEKENEEKEKKNLFFYGKVTTFGRDPDRWRWTNGGRFLDYTTKEGRESIVDRNPRVTRASEIW